ncbi:MAG: efflux RND transporter permease subunit [Desulfosalsimonadaceae bacterium]
MDRYMGWVLKWPKLVLAGFFMVTVLLGAGMLKLQFDTSIATFLPQQDIEYQYYNKVKEIYGDCDTFVILAVSHKNLWQYEVLNNINKLMIDLEEFEHYNPALEQQRSVQLDQALSIQEITGDALLSSFNADPAFKRQLSRKIETIGIPADPLSDRAKQKIKTAVTTASELKSRKMIDEIVSPFTIKDITGEDDMLETIDLIDKDANGHRIIPKTDQEINEFISRMKRNPAFEKGIYATDAKGNITDLGIVIRFTDMSDSDAIAREILEIVNSQKELTIIPQGQPIIYIWINNFMQKDLFMLVPLVMLVTIIIFFLNFKSIRGVVLPVTTLGMATLWILGLMGHLGAKITTIGISIPVLMIAVGSSYAIHIINQYYEDYDLITREGKALGLKDSMSHISVTVLLAGFTTIVSFLTLATHPLEALREWGLFTSLGIAFAVFISATVIPAGLELMPHHADGARFSRRKQSSRSFVDRIVDVMISLSIFHYKKVISVVMILMVVSVFGLLRLKVETELLQFFKKDNYIRTSATAICEKFGGRWGFNVLIDSGKADGIKTSKYLNIISDFRTWLGACENQDLCIGRTDAFPDVIKTMHMAMNNDSRSFFAIPDNNADITDYLEIYSDEDANSDGRVDHFESYVDPGFQTCNVLTRLSQNGDEPLGTSALKHIFSRISEHLRQTLPPGYSFKITGHPALLIKSVDYIVSGQVQSLFFSLVVIGIVVLMLMKNLKAGLLSLIPMSVAVIVNFGFMGWSGIRLDIATSTIAAITIGIGVDDTIHFLNTFRKFIKSGDSLNLALEHTLQAAGKAIIFTSLALTFGFSVLLLSTFKPLIEFGLLMMLTMTATTIGALLLLPSAIKLINMGTVKAKTGKMAMAHCVQELPVSL